MKIQHTCLGLLVSVSLIGCAILNMRRERVPVAKPLVIEFILEKPREQVYDAALSVAQELNLNIAVFEKQSGLVRFEATALSAEQLDKYCQFPFIQSTTKKPYATFVKWNRNYSYDMTFSGTVSLTLRLSDEGNDATKATLRGNWTVQSSVEIVSCNSLGVFEKEFETLLKSRL